MPVTTYTDSNGTYKAIGTAAWYGAEGQALRAQGWQYCGFGTNGIIIAPPGGQCYTRATPQQPNIIPIAPPPDTPGPSSAVPDKACGSCRKSSATITSPLTGAPTTPPPSTGTTVKKSGLPWWLWVLVALTLAQVVYNGRNTPSAS